MPDPFPRCLALLLSLISLLPTCLAEKENDRKKPNIIFFLIDDQRNDTLGCAGHPIVKTPVIDHLAKNGVRFKNAFVTTSICAASRASILTSLYERTHGYTFGKPPVSKNHILHSYPMLMRKAGYRTGFIGKYGVKTKGNPETAMFDVFQTHGRNPYFKKQQDGTLRHETEIAADKAIDFLKSQPDQTPFCLSISFNAVHAEDGDKKNHFPWPKAVNGMYDDIEVPAPRLNDPAIFAKHPDFMKASMNRHRYAWRWNTPEKYQKNIKAYFRMISGVDHAIGRIRKALELNGQSEDTIIVYMGDNGYYMGDRGFAGKWSHYEQSLRVPLIVFDPRADQQLRGQVLDQITLNIDLAPTLLELAGIPIPTLYQGRSYVSLLNGKKPSNWRTRFFCEHLMNHRDIPKWEGVRGNRFVYARYFDQDPDFEFLHDLKTDPDQLINLAHKPEYQTKLNEMRAQCESMKSKLLK